MPHDVDSVLPAPANALTPITKHREPAATTGIVLVSLALWGFYIGLLLYRP